MTTAWIDIPRAIVAVANEKTRNRLMARELRKAADRIEKGEGQVGYSVHMGLYNEKRRRSTTNLTWDSPEEIAKRKKRSLANACMPADG